MFRIISKKKLEELELNALKAGLSRDMVFRVQDFMGKCGQDVAEHSPEQVSLYIGLIAEELSEVMECLYKAQTFEDPTARHFYMQAISTLDYLASLGKSGTFSARARLADQAELLDGFIDGAIVNLGAAISASPQAYLATRKVLDANDAKTTGGRDENGKIKKPEGWQPPDLSDCVYHD